MIQNLDDGIQVFQDRTGQYNNDMKIYDTQPEDSYHSNY